MTETPAPRRNCGNPQCQQYGCEQYRQGKGQCIYAQDQPLLTFAITDRDLAYIDYRRQARLDVARRT